MTVLGTIFIQVSIQATQLDGYGPGRFFVNFRFTNFNIYVLDLQTSQIRTLQGCGGSEFGYRRKGVAPYRPLELHNGVNPTAR